MLSPAEPQLKITAGYFEFELWSLYLHVLLKQLCLWALFIFGLMIARGLVWSCYAGEPCLQDCSLFSFVLCLHALLRQLCALYIFDLAILYCLVWSCYSGELLAPMYCFGQFIFVFAVSLVPACTAKAVSVSSVYFRGRGGARDCMLPCLVMRHW